MDTGELRLWLAERLKMDPETDPVFDKLWRTLAQEGHVETAEQVSIAGGKEDEEVAKQDLLKPARALLPYAELEVSATRPSKSGGARTPRRAPRLDGYERHRAEAVGEYLALRGSLHPLVRRFREEVLCGKVLTSEQAHALVDSPAANRFSICRFEREGVPVVGHSARFYDHGAVLKRRRMDKFVEYEYIFVDPPGEVLRAHLPVSVAYDDLEYLRFPMKCNRKNAGDGGYSSVPCDSEYASTPVYPGSVLNDLRQLSQRLVDEYGRCWDEPQAAWFVLTDEPVAPRAITGTYHHNGSEHLNHGTITLTVEPWVPTETVVTFYQHLQAEMLGRKARAPEARNIEVFKFVVGRSRESLLGGEDQGGASTRPLSRELMERWNRENPSQRYTKESRFNRDFHRGGRALLWPYDEAELLPSRLSVP